jgi:hypothetical protein
LFEGGAMMKTVSFSELEAFIDFKRHELLTAVHQFGSDEHNAREYPEGWPVSQVIEHLVLVEHQIVDTIEIMLRSYPHQPTEPVAEKEVDIIPLLRSKGLLGTNKEAPKLVRPTVQLPLAEGLDKLNEIREQLKSYLPELAERETNSIIAHHSVLNVDLNVCQWIHFTAVHEWAHIHQLGRIRKATQVQD